MKRREFLRTALAGGLAAWASQASAMGSPAWASLGENIGELRGIKIRCFSDTGAWNAPSFMEDIMSSSGEGAGEHDGEWTKGNGRAYSALIEAETLDGKTHTMLLEAVCDVPSHGWGSQKEEMEGPPKRGGIHFLHIARAHLDHLWDLPVTCRSNPQNISVPHTSTAAEKLSAEKSRHDSEMTEHEAGKVHGLFPGCASVAFDMPSPRGNRSERVLLLKIKDKGMLIVMGWDRLAWKT